MRYEQTYNGEWNAYKWDNERVKCCSCGLVHRAHFRLKRIDGKLHLEVMVQVDKRATAAARRKRL